MLEFFSKETLKFLTTLAIWQVLVKKDESCRCRDVFLVIWQAFQKNSDRTLLSSKY
jgi:hypothetical protein